MVKQTSANQHQNVERCSSTASNSNVYMETGTTLPTTETETDEVMDADKALLNPDHLSSEADLYFAKM